jgi:arylsulfatase A-like enzyme
MRIGRLANTFVAALLTVLAGLTTDLRAQGQKPNIVVIWGDDIGLWNLSTYSHGAMGYRTPNIDRIGKEGAVFSDYYAQPSCTAGRAAFITGQLPIRSGMVTVGTPGSTLGLKPETVTLGEVLKTQGYATGQFGKNHLGDRNEHLPTVHGFDEFFGNLYHLNVSEEPEEDGYPTDPAFRQKYGPRGVLHCWATSTDASAPDPRYGKWGKQRCEDTGQLTRKRMENVDDEFSEAGFKFMDKAAAEMKPFFVWFSTSRMHVLTHTPAKYLESCKQYTSGDDPHCAGMLQHDENVGQILKKIDDLRIADNTIVIYSTDNGPEHSTWPYGATTPYRSEKMTAWEGAVRVPMLVRWPGILLPEPISTASSPPRMSSPLLRLPREFLTFANGSRRGTTSEQAWSRRTMSMASISSTTGRERPINQHAISSSITLKAISKAFGSTNGKCSLEAHVMVTMDHRRT